MSELFKDLVIDSESPSGLRWADTARRNRGKRVGALTHEGYWQCGYKNRQYKVHRIIMMIHLNRELSMNEVVDHINGDPSDNRVENLRVCSTSDNLCNMRLTNRNTTGVKGVSFKPNINAKNPYCVHIRANGKSVHGGYFATLDEAAEVANKLREELHGHYARFR